MSYLLIMLTGSEMAYKRNDGVLVKYDLKDIEGRKTIPSAFNYSKAPNH